MPTDTRPADTAPLSSREFRDAMGMFATGVTIVTARTRTGENVGLTVNSFNSVSLAPPLVLWALTRTASSLPAFLDASHFAVHVLTARQQPLAERFATRGIDRWAGLPVTEGLGNAPLLPDAAATFECLNLRQHEEGDHVLFIGQVQRCSRLGEATQPLLYHGGAFYTEHPLGRNRPAP